MARPRSLRVLFVRPGDRQGLHRGLSFAIPRERGDVLPLGLLGLASAVKYGSTHRALVHDERHPDVPALGPAGSLRGLSRALKPDVAVIWLHPALLADGLEAARQARHAGCSTVLGAGPLGALWPEAAGRVLEVDGLVGSDGGLLAGLEVLEAGGEADRLAQALASDRPGRWPLDRKLLDYARYNGVGGPPWAATGRPPGLRSDKGRFAASPVLLGQDTAEDVGACCLLGVRFVDLVGSLPDPGALSGLVASLPPGARMRLQVSPAELRSLSLTGLRTRGVEALHLGPLKAGDREAVDEACAVARTAGAAGFALGATAFVGAPGYSAAPEDAGLERLRSAGISLEVRVALRPDSDRWIDYADAPSASFLPPGIDAGRLAATERARPEAPRGRRRSILARR